ncbi:glycosyltransferase [Piscinibacter sp. XHJ-5]|uniref:glycosyltransferase n=1 Tax=Piscinibacter sp. XHJ-5 TaxID=3037797 RepID=UPI0024530E90|nr:glycosyltransferase [Piscinibacter sp. XHJ-5]
METLNAYESVVGPQAIAQLRKAAEPLAGRRVKMVNSTAVGGGVAEILHRLVPLLNELGIHTEWRVMEGDAEFFRVTKLFHYALQGDPTDIGADDLEIFLDTNRRNLVELAGDEDVVVIHDPQPLALIEARAKAPASRWVWRCHIDVSRPQPQLWEFLKPFVARYDAAIYSSDRFRQRMSMPEHVFCPPIDPLSDKNIELSAAAIDKVFARLGVPRDKPIVTQVSRFDRLKDPIGVVRAFRIARRHVDCRLVLVGGVADDDPDGALVLAEVLEEANGDPDIHVLGGRLYEDRDINALVRGSAIVLQKSLREGFGLTVAEAMWKGKPVIASAVGGLPLQVIDDVTGVLVSSVEETAAQIRALLGDPQRMRKLGEAGRRHVAREFLITRNLGRWLDLLGQLDADRAPPRSRRSVAPQGRGFGERDGAR